MMAFMTALLRFFVAIGIALWIIAGGVLGWFYDALPLQSAGVNPAQIADATAVTRAIASILGCIAGLFAATITFGVLALLLDIRDRLVIIADSAAGGRRVQVGQNIDGKPLNYER
jgi:hypothetical protein